MPEDLRGKSADNLSPSVLVIFGSTGDLVQRKLLPALYHLVRVERLPEQFKILCIARKDTTVTELIEQTKINLLNQEHDCRDEILARLAGKMSMLKMDSTAEDDFLLLKNALDSIDTELNINHNRLFYLAIPPYIFRSVISNLSQLGLNQQTADGPARRILVEKPFGSDLESAKDLVGFLASHFAENQIFRIDHYLAKETAQNILVFRFNNPLIEDIWDKQCIDHIQISATETIGIEGRGAFYDQMGALRDVVQSHLLQLMALVTMDIPQPLNSVNIHAEKLALLQSVQTINPDQVDEISVRGQYDGYKSEVENHNSTTESYAALKLEIANARWGGVPILLRTGKTLDKKVTEITIVFKDRTHRDRPSNLIKIRIQPNEGISLLLMAKKPGFETELQPVVMDFSYTSSFDNLQPDAYERVLVDALIGDQSLFATSDEVIRCWEILEPIIQKWKSSNETPKSYAKGSRGPKSAEELPDSIGTDWL